MYNLQTNILNLTAYIEESGADWLKDLLQTELGGWPLINQNFTNATNRTDFLLTFFKLSSQPIFKVGLDEDPNRRDYYILKVSVVLKKDNFPIFFSI